MKILQVTEFFSPRTGGSTQVAYQTARHLAQRGHQVTLCTSDFGRNDPPFPDIQFTVKSFRSLPTRWKFYITPGLIPWAARHVHEFDVIHMHNVRTFQNAVIAEFALRRQVPYIISAHGSLPHLDTLELFKKAFDQLAGRHFFAGAAAWVAVSQVEISQLKTAGVADKKIRFVPNGLDLNEFTRLPEPGMFRRQQHISDQAKILLFLGRLNKIKGLNYLIEAFALLKGRIAAAKLVIAGPDDGELTALRTQVKRLALEEHVLFTGPLYAQDRLAAYQDADVLASPGIYEIFGLVPFEAIMCGTPVVATGASASGQLIAEAQAGYLVPCGDVGALADAIESTIASPGEAQRKVTAGQAFIRQRLGWNVIIQDLEAIYSEVQSNGMPKNARYQGSAGSFEHNTGGR